MTIQDIHDRYRKAYDSATPKTREKISLSLSEQWINWKAVSTVIIYFPNGLRGGVKHQSVCASELGEDGHLNEELAKDFDFYFSELEEFLKGEEVA